MAAAPLNRSHNDDPRKLRDLIQKAFNLARAYELKSVVVGMSGVEGDLVFPEIVDYVGSALRVDDGIFRMTRERAVFFLADADRERAQEIMERLLYGFQERFSSVEEQRVSLAYFEVTPGIPALTVRDVLPSLFGTGLVTH
jgi:GGDEF domain-containing protein